MSSPSIYVPMIDPDGSILITSGIKHKWNPGLELPDHFQSPSWHWPNLQTKHVGACWAEPTPDCSCFCSWAVSYAPLTVSMTQFPFEILPEHLPVPVPSAVPPDPCWVPEWVLLHHQHWWSPPLSCSCFTAMRCQPQSYFSPLPPPTSTCRPAAALAFIHITCFVILRSLNCMFQHPCLLCEYFDSSLCMKCAVFCLFPKDCHKLFFWTYFMPRFHDRLICSIYCTASFCSDVFRLALQFPADDLFLDLKFLWVWECKVSNGSSRSCQSADSCSPLSASPITSSPARDFSILPRKRGNILHVGGLAELLCSLSIFMTERYERKFTHTPPTLALPHQLPTMYVAICQTFHYTSMSIGCLLFQN